MNDPGVPHQPQGYQAAPGYGQPQGFQPPAGQPHGGQPPAHSGGAPVVLNISKRTGRQALVGGALAGFFGVVALIPAFSANTDGQSHVWIHVVLFIIGIPLALIGLVTLLSLPVVLRKRNVVVTPTSFRWDDPHGTPFEFGWQEMSGIMLSTGENTTTGGRLTLLRVVIYPKDAAVVARHSEMQTLLQQHESNGQQRPRYVLPLGDQPKVVQPLSHALATHAPHGVYLGNQSNWARGVL